MKLSEELAKSIVAALLKSTKFEIHKAKGNGKSITFSARGTNGIVSVEGTVHDQQTSLPLDKEDDDEGDDGKGELPQ